VGEIPGAVLAALHAERGGQHAVHHLPQGRRFVVDWIVHKSLVCHGFGTSIDNHAKKIAGFASSYRDL
jgi:hypothetical protein